MQHRARSLINEKIEEKQTGPTHLAPLVDTVGWADAFLFFFWEEGRRRSNADPTSFGPRWVSQGGRGRLFQRQGFLFDVFYSKGFRPTPKTFGRNKHVCSCFPIVFAFAGMCR